MKILKAGYKFDNGNEINGEEILKKVERASRTCYKSEDKICMDSAKRLVKMILQKGHESCIEHESVTVRIVCDRGVSHEIVRHRIASYSQESTRYCNYSGEVQYIQPSDFELDADDLDLLLKIEEHYNKKIKQGLKPQQARYFLPNGLKTEIVVTMNLREWRHFFKLRTATAAHPDMRAIAVPLLKEFKEKIPIIFDDITTQE